MEENIKAKEIIGKINYYGFKGEIAEIIEYTDKESYLNAIKKEMDYNPDGFKYVTLTQDPQTRKAADDVVYDAYGADNPHTIEYYSPKVEDMQSSIKQVDGLKKSLMFGGNGLLDIRGLIDEENMSPFLEKYDLQKGAKTYEGIMGHELSEEGEKFINDFNMKVMTAAYQELQRIDRMDIIQEVKANSSFEKDITLIEIKLNANTQRYSQNKEDMNAQEKEDYLFVQDKRFSHLFSTLPEHRRTYRVSWAAVEADPKNLEFVPNKHLDKEIIKMAARKDGFAIEYIPSHKLNKEIYTIAVNQNGGALELVPDALKTSELCSDAVKNNGWALEFVPENLKTEEMCRVALTSELDSDDRDVMGYIPFPDVCLEGLKLSHLISSDPIQTFTSIDPKVMTPEIAMYGIKMTPACLTFIPNHLRTPELYKEVIKKDGLLLYKVP